MSHILDLLTQLVACKSTHERPDDIRRTGEIFSDFFQGLAIPQEEPHGALATLFTAPGITMPRILLLGHMDVVPADDVQFITERDGDRVTGRGTYDMKGPTAALAVAMRNVLERQPDASVGLLITGDEERGGFDGTGAWARHHEHHLPEVVFDPDGGDAFHLVTEEKGVLFVEVAVPGKSAHASRPWEGSNALERATDGLVKLREYFPSVTSEAWETSAVPTVFHSGQTGNQLPSEAVIRMDIRHIAKDTPARILECIQASFPTGKITVLKQASPFTLDTDHPAVRHLQACARGQFGADLKKQNYHSSCDARFFAERGIPVILMRSEGGGAHAPDEWVSLSGLDAYRTLVETYIETYGE